MRRLDIGDDGTSEDNGYVSSVLTQGVMLEIGQMKGIYVGGTACPCVLLADVFNVEKRATNPVQFIVRNNFKGGDDMVYRHYIERTDGSEVWFTEGCLYCCMTSSGQHESDCPCKDLKIAEIKPKHMERFKEQLRG